MSLVSTLEEIAFLKDEFPFLFTKQLTYKPYSPKPSYIFTNSYWLSLSSCDWFWSDDLEWGLLA